jgi:hypothetical protein
LTDLQVYGKSTDTNLYAGKYKLGVPIKIDNDTVGTFKEANDSYTAYTINEKKYYDFPDGTTVFIVESSGITSDMLVCSAITKNEALINVIDEPEIQSDVFIERGKQSGLESVVRLGEVDNVGDLEKYGYGFYKVNEI